jgi:hypothetical protein
MAARMGTGTNELRVARRNLVSLHVEHRRYVRFSEVTEYQARSPNSIGINAVNLKLAYSDLIDAAEAGAFERLGRSEIRYIGEEAPPSIMDAAFLKARKMALGEATFIDAYLSNCWVPIEIALDWCANNKINPPPRWQDISIPMNESAAAENESSHSGKKMPRTKEEAVVEMYLKLWPQQPTLLSNDAIREAIIEGCKTYYEVDRKFTISKSSFDRAMKTLASKSA